MKQPVRTTTIFPRTKTRVQLNLLWCSRTPRQPGDLEHSAGLGELGTTGHTSNAERGHGQTQQFTKRHGRWTTAHISRTTVQVRRTSVHVRRATAHIR
ncbi:hypothetical protein BaRGS_00007990 [Batillaria attramentaria]|uniref:Uncharacterized protein n=1 Tax=Batillaria attramentaria TaxID=370345 RepID=A0ABD0LN93_9CAEN